MANPLAFGFMDPQQALALNWEQSRPAMGPIEAMSGMPDLYRQAAQQQHSHQPFANDFLRRFGQPMVEQQQQSPMQPDMLQALMAEGNMIHALTNADARGAGTSFDQTARGGEGEVYYGGDTLANQPWLDEFAAAGRAGVDLPMLHGKAGKPNDAMKAGIAERRQQRLEEAAPALSLADRKKNVMNQALIKSEQRAGRMGDISPQEQFFNQAGRFAGDMGEGGGDFLNGIFFGGQAMADIQGNRLKAEEAQKTRDWASSPEGIAASIAAAGGQPQPAADPVAALVERSGGDWEKFKVMATQAGIPASKQVQGWGLYTGQKKGGPAQPGLWTPKFSGWPDWMGLNTATQPQPQIPVQPEISKSTW